MKELSQEQSRELQRLSERFARGLAASLGPGLRRKFEGLWVSTELLPVADCERPETDLVLMMDVGPMQVPAAVAFDSDLARMLIDAFLGSPAGVTYEARRELTEIERSILEGVHPFLTGQLEAVWKDVRALSFAIRDQRNGLRKSHLKGMSEPLAAVTLRLICGDASGELTILYPMTLVALIATSAASPAPQIKVAVTPEKLLQQLNQATVEVEATLEGSTIRLGDFLELQTGDLLRLETAVGHPLDLRINGESRMSAKLSPGGKKRSLRVERLLASEGEAQPAPADRASE
jgi:flagellar motor switch protein FliM